MTKPTIPQSDTVDNALLHTALAYARRGWPVFPCHTPRVSGCACGLATGSCPQLGSPGHTPLHVSCSCTAGTACRNLGKHPRTLHGLKDATTDATRLGQWWAKWPDANIGLVTGSISGVVVLDVDPRHGANLTLEDLEAAHQKLPETVESLSGGGGRHLFLQHPGVPIRNNAGTTLGPGLDIRGDGGYVILPPSLHASGRRYEWEVSSHPDDLAVAPMPPWLLARLGAPISPYIGQPSGTGERIPQGQRNTTLTSLAGAMRRRGMSEAAILAALLEDNRRRCDPPLSPGEVRRIAASVSRYAPAIIAGRTEAGEAEARCPPLPDQARVDEILAAEASRWLDDYIAWSRTWAPRAFEEFHEACGLFDLSTIAARRVRIAFGHGHYTSLYMALTSRTTLYTKSTAADLAVELLRRAGLGMLLADDDATPQAFLRAMTAHVPENADDFSAEAKVALCQQLAFAAQRGWFYEEFGQHLAAMMQREGVMAAFRSILRRFDDQKETYIYHTIGRGREQLDKPYVTLLANLTPADLRPFAHKNSALWRDGYLARFGFIVPPEGTRSDAEFPREAITYPRRLIDPLRQWHRRLGIPQADLDRILDRRHKPTGRYRIRIDPLPETTYHLSPAVWHAYYRYDRALRAMASHQGNEDLDGSYGRFAIKALRIAALLASLHDDRETHTIELAAWSRGQQIAERWRASLHRLMGQVQDEVTLTHEEKAEHMLIRVLRKYGALTARELHQRTKIPYTVLVRHLEVMSKAGVVQAQKSGRTLKYGWISLDETHEARH